MDQDAGAPAACQFISLMFTLSWNQRCLLVKRIREVDHGVDLLSSRLLKENERSRGREAFFSFRREPVAYSALRATLSRGVKEMFTFFFTKFRCKCF